MKNTENSGWTCSIVVMVVAAAVIAAAAAVAGAQTRDRTGTPMVHQADEAPQVVRNEPLAEPRSEGTERVGLSARGPSPGSLERLWVR